MPKVVIELKDVWKKYPEEKVEALKGVNIKIHEGDFVSIIGPSGSGKSTCMNLIGLLDTPTHGKIYLDGRDVSKLSEDQLAQLRGQKIGFIFQQFNLIPTLTALENVLLPVIFQDVDEKEYQEKALELIKKVNLEDRAKHLPRQLSGGEQQRVAIARSLINSPELVLADEPTGNLDSKTGAQIMQILTELHNKGKTLVVITHDPRIAQHAHKVINLVDGKVVYHGNVKEYVWKR